MRQDRKPVSGRVDRSHDFIARGRARQDGACASKKRIEAVFDVDIVNKSNEGCFIAPDSPIGQLLARRRMRQDGVGPISVNQREHGCRIARDTDDCDGRITAQKLFEAAAQERIGGEYRDGDHGLLARSFCGRRHSAARLSHGSFADDDLERRGGAAA